MKTTLKIALSLVIAALLGLSNANAQKLGYIDLQELMAAMPEYKTANSDMEKYGKSLEDEMKKMSEEFQKKLGDYQKNMKTMNELVRESKEKELQDMQTRIQEFQQSAQENVRKKEAELLKPIIEKAKEKIALVAKEGGYGYIFDSNTAGFLYKPEGENLINAVKKKMGLL